MNATGNPPYGILNDMDSFAHPMIMENVRFTVFTLRSSFSALQSLCDKYCNNLTHGQIKIVPVLPVASLGCAWIRKGRLVNPPASEMGWMSEIDVAFWILVAVITPSSFHLAWILPYVFVNKDIALTMGREIFGFRKQLADIIIPMQAGDAARYSVSGMAIPRYDPTVEITKQNILEIWRTDAQDMGPITDSWDDPEQAYEAFLNMLLETDGVSINPELQSLFDKNRLTMSKQVRLLFVKQFTDSEDGRLACYQAVIDVAPRVISFYSGGFLSGSYQARINTLRSHPMITDLGLSSDNPRVLSAVNFNFSFALDSGTVLWRA